MRKLNLLYQVITTRVGELLVAGTPYAITHLCRGESRSELTTNFMMQHESVSAMGDTGYIKEICEQITQYLAGERTHIEAALLLNGTEFQRKVWQVLRQIPYGQTLSYSDVAEQIGSPDAFRAVANACGENPVPLIVPCHRVVHKSGDTSGFAWGKDIKNFLLSLERGQETLLREAMTA